MISTSKHGRLIDRLAIPVFVALGLLTAPGFSIAEDIEWRQGNNSLILPQYCQDYVSQWDRNIPGRWEKWRAHFGPVFIHMHHYCGGVYAEKKARQTFDKRKRDRWLYEVVNQMQYVSPYCDTKCVLYGELHRRWAWALFQQGNSVEAMKHLELLKAAQVVPAGKQP